MRANTGEQLREVAAALKQDQRNYLHEVMQGRARIAELERQATMDGGLARLALNAAKDQLASAEAALDKAQALNVELRAQLKAKAVIPEKARDALAWRCLWIAYVWNDHNFLGAYKYAREEAESHGITSFDEANEWLEAQPQSDQDYIHLCDYCGALTDDPWHGSGEMHGKENRHIHACDNCRDRLPKYAAPAQPGSAKGGEQ